ncbi:MAG: histidinol-phosphate transaminase [Clostridiales Family XIII bacterium]|jgi:histidinol-phosphate aminotransferase|nr:histidinol-phosphate transaminase [Clostridiales Family XIII bacterium]
MNNKPTIEALTRPGIQKIPPYVPGDTAESVRKKYQVTNIIKLASNENQIGMSPKAVEAVRAELENAYIYPDPSSEELRLRLGERFDLTPHNVVVTMGGSGGIALISDVFLNPGDEVLYCAPTFGAYSGSAARNGAVCVTLPLKDTGEFDLEALAAAVTDKTKIVYVCNPNNPTGGTLPHDEVVAFVDALPPHVICVVDEAYIEFAEGEEYRSVADAVNEDRRMIVMRTFSKAYGLAGLRIGYLLTSTEIHANLMKAVITFTGNRYGLAAAIASLDDKEYLAASIKNVVDGRKYLREEFEKLGFKVYPSQANFIYVDTGLSTADFAEKLKKKGLVIRGNFEYNRVTIGTPEQNEQAVRFVKEVLEEGVEPRVAE